MQQIKIVKTGSVREGAPAYTSPLMVYESMRDEMNSLDREHFMVMHVDVKHRVIARETISIGSLSQAIVHPREVFKGAVHNGSAAIICMHNHPSGDPRPSTDDITVTRRLKSAGEILGIHVLDHIITGDRAYFSFKESGLIDRCAGEEEAKPQDSLMKVCRAVLELEGEQLARERKRAKMTQAALSKATGIPVHTLSSVERGRKVLSEKQYLKLGDALGIDGHVLFRLTQKITRGAIAASN